MIGRERLEKINISYISMKLPGDRIAIKKEKNSSADIFASPEYRLILIDPGPTHVTPTPSPSAN